MSSQFSYNEECQWAILGRLEKGSSIEELRAWLDGHLKAPLALDGPDGGITLGGFIGGLIAVGKLKLSDEDPNTFKLTPSGRRELRRLSDKALANIVG